MKEKENLRRLNEELENYFRNTIIPQLFVDANLILRKFTPPAMKQFNLSAADVGKSITDVVDNFRFPSMIENIQSVINSNEILEKEIQTTDMRWYQMNVIPYIRMGENKTDGVIITFVEITRRIIDLKDLEKLITDYELLLDSLSHDIKNPLANLTMAINQFKKIGLSSQKNFQDLLGMVETSLSKMQKLIKELLESREQEHRYKSHMELLNIEHILEDVRLALNEEILNSGAVINTDIQVAELNFTRRKMRSIIFNLLNNSIKYKSPEKQPHISITTFHENGYAVISVKDNGRGIDPEKQESVFKKYFRGDNPEEGSGIGLYLVKEMVENTGGKIQLESQPGEGTEIKVFLKEK
jgi:two-component system, OmpR family, phosphate regulon sensor histidine kinase PhoR